MARARKAAHNGPAIKHYYFDCPTCNGEKEVLRVLVVGLGRNKRLMCSGCRTILSPDAKVVKK